MPTNTINSKIDEIGVDPKEVAAIEKSVKSRDQAPTVMEQTGSFVDWKAVRDQLGQPFDITRIPIRKLDQMRRDAMIAFALHYRKTPLVRAPWHIEARDKNGPNAQVAGFFDAAWRQVHARYIFQHTLDFDYGFASIVKQFKLGNPGGVYFDPLEENPDNALKPVWDEGNVDPIIWKPFVALPPGRVQPVFKTDGTFDGMLYEPPPASGAAASGGRRRGGSGTQERKIDVWHTLWATNDKDSVFGNIFGYPLIAHSYRYWWSYWFLWANIDRAFERMAVPPMVAYHPEGEYVDPEDPSNRRPYWEIALEAAESLRSNSIAAVPSTLATSGLEERGSQKREWSFEFIETPEENFDALHKYLNYLDVMKLRACWVPEQAFIEGEGGTSSRNVAAQMSETFWESQANKWEEIADHINRYIFPQMAAVNFPEFVNNGGTVKIVGHGFAKEDVEFLKQIIQLVGQADPMSLEVDMRAALERIGAPLKSPQQLARERSQIAATAAAGGPPQVDPTRNAVGTVPNPGFTNGGSVPEPNSPGASVTGFSDQPYIYINPREMIELSDHDDFLASLPQSSHYADKTMRALAVQLRRLWLGALREMYPDFAKWLASQPALELSEELPDEYDDLDDGLMGDDRYDGSSIMFAGRSRNRRTALRTANRLLREWTFSSKRLSAVAEQSRKIIEKMVVRSAKIVSKSRGLDYEIVADAYNDYLDRQIGKLVKSVHGTTKKNLRSLLVNEIVEGRSAVQIADKIRDHFDEFPDWRADRIARSETRDAYNAATLIVSENSGVKYVRAKDAQLGPTDEHCEQRNGKLFTVKEAWKQMGPKLTHPYDTLEFEPIARATFSVVTVEELPEDAPEGAAAWYDQSKDIAYVPIGLSDEDADEFLSAVADHILEAA